MFTMDFIVEGGMDRLWDLRERNRRLLEYVQGNTGQGLDRMVAGVTLRVRDAAEARSPYLTGTLASAHRGEIEEGGESGLIYIDPFVRNPLNQGNPAIYGPIVHNRRDWFAQTVEQDAPGILVDEGSALIRRMGEIYD